MEHDRIGTETNSACYLCGKQGEVLYRNLTDRFFGAPGAWTLRKCKDAECGVIWLDPRPTLDEIGKAYHRYYTHGQVDLVRQTRTARIGHAILHAISINLLGLRRERRRYKCIYLDKTPPGRLLEVGCGNGKWLVRMRALGWDVMGQEVDPAAAEHVHKKKGIPVHLGPLETIEPDEYDVVILSHVIEHVHDPVATLTACHRLLKKNGLLIVLTPNAASYGHGKFGAAWRGLEPPRHLHLIYLPYTESAGAESRFQRAALLDNAGQRVWNRSGQSTFD
jgi:2-polyprenyl-3-methyl-5-hydroxy-6-metoxy-1,4-benzoquinol methylase